LSGIETNEIKAKSELEDWDKGHFIFADEGADPILVNMDAPEHGVV
jgi:hypothetical protein